MWSFFIVIFLLFVIILKILGEDLCICWSFVLIRFFGILMLFVLILCLSKVFFMICFMSFCI